ncbi:MAG TPA: hypothetical protein VFT87_00835 [Candidatus Saccharimonadales bacterium]|nr:hypothetical protein [Candidatus Saccharimonadales bacterium]
MKRFFASVAVVLVLAGCTAQRKGVNPLPSGVPTVALMTSLSPHLANWSSILEIFATGWAAERLDASQLNLEVLGAAIVDPAELRVCAEAPQFNHSKSFLAYCQAAVAQPPSSGPKGVVLIPHDRFMQSIATMQSANGEQRAYEALVILLALFYADHLVSEADQAGLLSKGQVKEEHRYCLAGGVVRASAQKNRVSLVGESVAKTLAVAVPFIQLHRQALPRRAADWLLRGLNSGSGLALDTMCA